MLAPFAEEARRAELLRLKGLAQKPRGDLDFALVERARGALARDEVHVVAELAVDREKLRLRRLVSETLQQTATSVVKRWRPVPAVHLRLRARARFFAQLVQHACLCEFILLR
jgi:hypothetical protein